MKLSDWPRPIDDNGIGIHFGNVTKRALDRYLPLLKDLHIKWVVLASESDENIGKVATQLLQENIMPIARPQRPINRPAHFGHLAEACRSPFVQIYNEFGDQREWWYRKPQDWWEYSKKKWIKQAHRVRSVGCYPGLQVMDTEELKDILIDIVFNEGDLIDHIWLSLHLYPHKGCPPTCMEHEDDVLGFLRYAKACEEVVGFVPPIIVTEGGWTDGQGMSEERALWMTTVYNWFRDGKIYYNFPNSEGILEDMPLPEYLFAFCPFILFGKMWFGFSWADNINHQPMVNAVKEMEPFVRRTPNNSELPNNWWTGFSCGLRSKASDFWRLITEWTTKDEVEEREDETDIRN